VDSVLGSRNHHPANRPKPRKETPKASKTTPSEEQSEPRSIPERYPNHVWSIDTTTVLTWGLWPIHIFVAIDHYSRKVVSVTPLEGPNSGWILEALENAFEKHGAPKHIISDQANVFTGGAYAELLDHWDVKPRWGAIGKHGSIAVTERANKTLKYEWLKRVPVIMGLEHLERLCDEFSEWYNSWRPHMFHEGQRPDDVFYGKASKKPNRNVKRSPPDLQIRFFKETRTTGYRLKSVA